jgi:hypothetical protein
VPAISANLVRLPICEWHLSRRDSAIVAIRRAIACSWRAWHEVPGNVPPQKSRPVGYGLILAGVRTSIR